MCVSLFASYLSINLSNWASNCDKLKFHWKVLSTTTFNVLNLSNLKQLKYEDENKANQLIGNLKLIRYVSIFKHSLVDFYGKLLLNSKILNKWYNSPHFLWGYFFNLLWIFIFEATTSVAVGLF